MSDSSHLSTGNIPPTVYAMQVRVPHGWPVFLGSKMVDESGNAWRVSMLRVEGDGAIATMVAERVS